MNVKRETSTAVADLHMNSLPDSIKRLAMSQDGHPETALHIHNPESLNSNFTGGIVTVMSNAQEDFRGKYDVIRELGKGGFSTVYQCRERATGADFAVKVVDLRPLRLRERFNPARLRREVDIMKRLHHPNIIQFEAVFEDTDHLMMVRMRFLPL
jgi:serine/threonine protein kinase